jgi:hypothetical protein
MLARGAHSHTGSAAKGKVHDPTATNQAYRSNTPQHFRNNPVSQLDIIKSFFVHKTKEKELNTYLEERTTNNNKLKVPDVAQLLYSAALNNHTFSNEQLDKMVAVLQKYINQNQPKLQFHKYFFSPVHFSRLMYGLKVYNNDTHDAKVSPLLTALNKMLQLKNTNTFRNDGGPSANNAIKNGNGSVISTNSVNFDARSFSMCLYGLQNMRIDNSTNGPILLELIRKLREIAIGLNDVDPFSLSYMIHGVKSMRASNVDVQELLAVIINKAVHLKAKSFTYQLVCNNISGLMKHEDLTSREALSLLHIITEKFKECENDSLDANLMGVFFFHMREINTEDLHAEEVREFLSTLTNKVEESPAIPSPSQIANMLYTSRNMPSDLPEVRRMQKVVLQKAMLVEGKFSPRDLSKCMSSLKHINIFESQTLLSLLTRWFDRGLMQRKRLNTKDMNSCLYGLRHVKCNSEEVRQLIRVFAKSMGQTAHPLDAASVVHAFHFLRSADCAHPEVQAFVHEINQKVLASKLSLDKRQLNIIYGLSCIQNPYPTIRPLVDTLSIALAPLPALAARTGLGFLGGLQHLNSDYPETRKLLSRLVVELEANSFKLHHASDVGYSLQQSFLVVSTMTDEWEEVRGYLNYLVSEVETMLHVNPSALVGTNVSVISDCLFALRHMTSSSDEVQAAVGVLRQCAHKCKSDFCSKDILHALRGVQRMDLHSSYRASEVRLLLGDLGRQLDAENDQGVTARDIGMALHGLRGVAATSTGAQEREQEPEPEVQELLWKLLVLADAVVNPASSSSPSPSPCISNLSSRSAPALLAEEVERVVLGMPQLGSALEASDDDDKALLSVIRDLLSLFEARTT